MPKGNKKRKRRDSSSEDERILRKIHKLQKQLRNHKENFLSDNDVASGASPFSSHSSVEGAADLSFNEPTPALSDVVQNIITPEGPSQEEPPALDENILSLLGKLPSKSITSGPPLHKDVATRWITLINEGLVEEEKLSILRDYPPADNCLLLNSPKLNPEIAKALNIQIVKRDENLAELQNQIGGALSALGKLLT
ncbi:hypothetical protein PPYR_15723 [Photinus pyralis]|uniref:Uncharacterized protein n=2 Tax=Photinus pyralis TaxID=7054 RepID=A0A5N3ZY41_PHOPY|nr:hypothetical protein PPYR_15723 [Photinus pyralis]